MNSYLISVSKQLDYYRGLGKKTMDQLQFDELTNEIATDANSMATLVKHLSGNMLSRWTNFLTEDGEKTWRDRDGEFEANFISKKELMSVWNEGWDCLFSTIQSLTTDDLDKIIFIRHEGHTVTEAINRQLMHYAYHVGQIVYLGKIHKGADWQSLSIPKGQSKIFNDEKFKSEKTRKHFTDGS